MTVTTDWYAILGIKSTATEEEIKKAYRKKALQYHPDKNSSTTAEEVFKEINKAYEILGDTDKRRTYDLQQQTSKVHSSFTHPHKNDSSSQSFFTSKNHHSSRFNFHDPFCNTHQRHAFFNHRFHTPHFSFFDTHFGSSSSDDDDHDYDHCDSIPSAFRSSHNHFRRKPRSKWDHPWSFDTDPFMMFEMLTRSIFDQFLHDDLFWHNSSARLRSASHQHRGPSTNRTRIPVNHVTPAPKYRNDMKRTTSSSCFNHKDSDEENIDDHFVYQESKPTSTNTNNRFGKYSTDHSTNNKQKLETCRYCFYPSTSVDNRLKHEAICRHRLDQDRVYTTKCSYCQQNIRLSDYLHHEELCKQFGQKRPTTTTTTTETKRYYNPMSTSLNTDNQLHGKSSSAGISNDINRLRTCHRCHRNFPVLSDLFNHICDDEDEQNLSNSTTTSTKSDNKIKNNSPSLFDNIASTSPKSFKLNTNSSLDTSPMSSRTYKLVSPLSPSSSPTINHSDLTSIHVQPRNDSSNKNQSSLETEHIPLFKRPLFQPDMTATNDKQPHSSSTYIYLRNPSTPLRVNS